MWSLIALLTEDQRSELSVDLWQVPVKNELHIYSSENMRAVSVKRFLFEDECFSNQFLDEDFLWLIV